MKKIILTTGIGTILNTSALAVTSCSLSKNSNLEDKAETDMLRILRWFSLSNASECEFVEVDPFITDEWSELTSEVSSQLKQLNMPQMKYNSKPFYKLAASRVLNEKVVYSISYKTVNGSQEYTIYDLQFFSKTYMLVLQMIKEMCIALETL